MCLVAVSWKNHPKYPLLISANRDEFFERPTMGLSQWDSGFFGGKDLRSGGTWLGFHPNGKWALLTNYRDFTKAENPKISRGKLVQDFLEQEISPIEYLKYIQANQTDYAGFNLLISDGEQLHYLSNYSDQILTLPPGIYGLSNGLLDANWPKIKLAKEQLKQLSMESEVSVDQLLQILKSTHTFPKEELPNTGVPIEMEIGLSSQLIRLDGNYGTVSATAVVKDQNGKTRIKERTFKWVETQFQDREIEFDQTKTS